MTDLAIGELDKDRLSSFGGVLARQVQQESRQAGRAAANAESRMWRNADRHILEARRRENLAGWIEFHMNLAESFALLSGEHRRKARALQDQEVDNV